MCSTRKFLKEEKNKKCCFVVIPKGISVNIQRENISMEVRRMLTEFKEILVDEMSMGLLMTRRISHHIDLILGLILPKEVSHRMIPTEYIKLNQQVQELLDMGLIRENLSLCVVPRVLELKKGLEWRM